MGSTPEQRGPEPVDLAAPAAEGSGRDGTTTARPRRRRTATLVVAIAAVAALVGVAVVVSDSGSGHDTEAIDTFAPDVTVGDANLVVLATSFDREGARNLVPGPVVTALGQVPGVKAAEGVLRTFAPLEDLQGRTLGHGRSTIALSWNGTAGMELREGRPPVATGEVALDVDTLDEHDLSVGDQVRGPGSDQSQYGTDDQLGSSTVTIVGSFAIAGDDAGVPGVALSAFDAATLLAQPRASGQSGFDRVDLIVAPDADHTEVAARVAAALPPGLEVVPASRLGSREQLRSELEIQRAFFDMLSLDEATRNAAGELDRSPEARAAGNATFQRYLSQVTGVEFRVQRVNFLDADHASLVFMTYYGGNPSPVLTEPFDAHAVRVDGVWKVSNSTICTLALLGGGPCLTGAGQPVEPPPGWQTPSTQPEVVDAFSTFAAPGATADTRIVVLEEGEPQRAVVEAGITADAPFAAVATLTISGTRLVDADHAEIFYSLTTPGHPELETPYPLIGRAVRDAGTWKVAAQYACGLQALALGGCDGSGVGSSSEGSFGLEPTPTTAVSG